MHCMMDKARRVDRLVSLSEFVLLFELYYIAYLLPQMSSETYVSGLLLQSLCPSCYV